MNLIFDIGANLGLFTEACLTTFPGCRVVAVEANPNLINELHKRFRDYNVILLNELVGTVMGEEAPFYICSGDTLSTAKKKWTTHSRFAGQRRYDASGNDVHSWMNQGLTMECVNLDWLVSKYGSPDLIKIDVEGYELEVLRGLSTRQGRICFEFCEEFFDETEAACNHLQSIGYSEFSFTCGGESGRLLRRDYPVLPPGTESSPPESSYRSWGECDELRKGIVPDRKILWGNIWVR